MRYKLAVWAASIAAPVNAAFLILQDGKPVQTGLLTAATYLAIELIIYRIALFVSNGILKEDLRKYYWNIANEVIDKKPPYKMFLSSLLSKLSGLYSIFSIGRMLILSLALIAPMAIIFFPGVFLIVIGVIIGIGYTIRFIGEVFDDSKWEILKVSMLPKIPRKDPPQFSMIPKPAKG